MDTKRSRNHRRALAAGLVVLLSFTAACSDGGSDDASEERTTTTDAKATSSTVSTTTTTTADPVPAEDPAELVRALVATYSGDATKVLDETQALCIAGAWVETLGAETFADSGVTAAQIESEEKTLRNVVISEEQGVELGDDVAGCGVDVRSIIYGILGPVAQQPNVRTCIDAALTDDQVNRLLVSQFTALPPPADGFEDAVACFPG